MLIATFDLAGDIQIEIQIAKMIILFYYYLLLLCAE